MRSWLSEQAARHRERAAVYRRWRAWEFETWLRRHTAWRRT